MYFQQIPRHETGCLAYLVGDEDAGECAVIDPPQDAPPLVAAAQADGMRIVEVIETHTHADHLSGARTLAGELDLKPRLPFLSHARYPHDIMLDGRDIRVGDVRLRAMHTPGHTPCSMSLVADDRAIVGDALLIGTVGRSDFYDDGPDEMYHTIFDRLLKLDDRLLVYPAHFGPKHGLPDALSTTVGHERRVSEPLTLKSKDAFIEYMTEGWPPKPEGWRTIVEANNHE